MNEKTIKFDPPLLFAGDKPRAEVTMREPMVKDMRIADRTEGGDLDREVVMIARLTGINIEDLDTLSASQYKQLQNEYAAFFSPGGRSSDEPV